MTQLTNKINRTIRAGVNSLLTDLTNWNRDKLMEAKIKWYHEYKPLSPFVAADISGLNLGIEEKAELSRVIDDPPGTPIEVPEDWEPYFTDEWVESDNLFVHRQES